MGERERTREELRRWGQPGRRADLIANAWRAGNTNVTDLTRLAGLNSRTQTYADLRARGINSDDRPAQQEEPMTVTIDGYTGTEPDYQVQRDVETLHRRLEAEGAPRAAAEAQKKADAWRAARWHNVIAVPTAQDERNAYHRVQVARAKFDNAYDLLATTSNDMWIAAHHAVVRASRELQDVVEQWRCDAEELDRVDQQRPWVYYDAVPEDQYVSTEPSESPALFPGEIERLIAERREIVDETAQLCGAGGEQ